MEGDGSGAPASNVEPSGEVMGLIQRNTDEKHLLENPSETLPKATLMMMLYPAAQVLWLGSHVVVFSTCELQTAVLL